LKTFKYNARYVNWDFSRKDYGRNLGERGRTARRPKSASEYSGCQYKKTDGIGFCAYDLMQRHLPAVGALGDCMKLVKPM